jgi:ketosteroid isomerase-like protein
MNEKELKERLDKLEEKITLAEDILEIKKVINKYRLNFQGADANAILQDFAFEMDDVSVDGSMGGKFVGERPIREFFDQRPVLARMPGAIVEHDSTTQVVVVAKDGKTARVANYSPGYKCLAQAYSQVWSLGKTYYDMIKIDGKWKIWHMHWFIYAEGEAAYGWLYQQRSYYQECLFPALDGIHNFNITVPPVPCPKTDNYRTDKPVYYYPEPPTDYETWDKMEDIKKTRKY